MSETEIAKAPHHTLLATSDILESIFVTSLLSLSKMLLLLSIFLIYLDGYMMSLDNLLSLKGKFYSHNKVSFFV